MESFLSRERIRLRRSNKNYKNWGTSGAVGQRGLRQLLVFGEEGNEDSPSCWLVPSMAGLGQQAVCLVGA